MTKRAGIIEKKEAQGINNPTRPRLLPLKQAAEYLGLTTWAIRERIWAGQIPVVRFPGGRKMYVDRNDIDRFIESHKTVIT
jgi:excisionase family DNA binding protein